ncbi:MAG: 16S rRNA (adenine(1518)-N(6)/adenine(1519)-N(6))-dimethyltransferase RsmA [Bacteroidales bacterium]|nr:16S rRNA (adenine(1518)-N(6)/adenine(1519)-N(6))-dimethyltransferase RsmA [Bacteroidales bacterium]MCF8389371.1 16S rRNA (adenine(1518)-N(6)/adenine(1519)-N(6))-dimethyltransferase RsmA [Bacteroidales bacterium]
MIMVKPKKHLGQHFLTDTSIAERITNLLDIQTGNTIIEVGPGKGILSDFLIKKAGEKLKLIEIDQESVEYLREKYPEIKEQLIEGDFLKQDLNQFGDHLLIIGNFPYNISSQIFFKILESKNNVDEVVCMIQKEVAQRIASGPGNKQYGILSVLLQTWYDIKLEFNVKPGSFFPPPAVNSSVIRLKRNARKDIDCDEKFYKSIIKMSFNQRRKVLSNSLKSVLVNSKMESVDKGLRRRPEELSVEDFLVLCNALEGGELI